MDRLHLGEPRAGRGKPHRQRKGERYALALLTARLDMWFGSDGRTPSEHTEAVRVGLDVLAEATREAPDQTIQALERIAAAGFCLLAREIGGDPQGLLRRVALGYAARREAGTSKVTGRRAR